MARWSVFRIGHTRQIETTNKQKERPGLLQSGIIFHHDTASAHTARIVTELLDEYERPVLKHPCYSADLGPCHFWLFPKTKGHFVVKISVSMISV
ncbi:transposase [Plakobranchus ocellatus]|uniref:Transposase n=1 Tax=Plakobranchus ocellatus TaxID=259542 RepID=A0AAV4BCW5_9GAST|nr:transposase [Plakobranchus ocellatus]